MEWGNIFLKKLILKTCSPWLQQRLRHFYLVQQVIKNRSFREPEMAVLKSLLCGGEAVADIGANAGVYTMELASLVGPCGIVYSFEPIAGNFGILRAVIYKAHLSNVCSFHAALGARLEQREMVIPELGGFTGYYWAHFAQSNDLGRREVVEVLTLDELWKQNTIRGLDFIKCDVEGGELEVIQGGVEFIQAQRPGWLLEVSRKTSDGVFHTLKDLGYRAFVYRDHLSETKGYQDKEFSNYFFFHPNSKIWQRVLPLFGN